MHLQGKGRDEALHGTLDGHVDDVGQSVEIESRRETKAQSMGVVQQKREKERSKMVSKGTCHSEGIRITRYF